jgi:ribonucleoside-triphosphate reductase
MGACGQKTELYSRVCGYFRPVANWNRGKKQEFLDRKNFIIPTKKEIKKRRRRANEELKHVGITG